MTSPFQSTSSHDSLKHVRRTNQPVAWLGDENATAIQIRTAANPSPPMSDAGDELPPVASTYSVSRGCAKAGAGGISPIPQPAPAALRHPIPYAGFDPTELRRSSYSTTRSKRADRMFRAGLDTLEIAKRIGVREPRILKYISIERSLRLGLPLPYGRR